MFIGYTPTVKRNDTGEAIVTAYEVRSMVELEQAIGKPSLLKEVIIDNAGNITVDHTGICYLYHAVRLFFVNGGGETSGVYYTQNSATNYSLNSIA